MGYVLLITVFIAGPFMIAGIVLLVIGLILRHRDKVRMENDPDFERSSTVVRTYVILGIIFFATPLVLFLIFVVVSNIQWAIALR